MRRCIANPIFEGFYIMDIKNFEDLLAKSLYNTSISNLNSLVASAPELKPKAMVEINNFIVYIRRKIGKIYSYIQNNDNKKPLILIAPTNNFVFSYTIFPDNKSKIDLKLILSISREYDYDFIEYKIKDTHGFVYFIKSDYGYKIGCTANFKKRLNSFNIKLPFKISSHSYIKCKNYMKIESFLHEKLKHKRLNGEWFDLSENDFKEIDKILFNMKLNRITE